MRLPVFLLLLVSFSGTAQPVLYQPADLKKDFSELFQKLNDLHPGVNRYTSADSLRQVYDRIYQSLDKPMTAWELFRRSSVLTAAVKCGHTRMRPSDTMQRELEQNGRFFPLAVQFAGTTLYARLPDQSVREVMAINKKSVTEVLKAIFARLPKDGDAVASRYDMITDNFWTSYAWYVDFSAPEFEINLRSNSGQEVKTFTAATFEQASKLRFYAEKGSATPLLSFEKQGSMGFVQIKTFSSYEINGAGLSYPKFLEDTFTQIEKDKTGQLIIDIRGNGGGDDKYGALLCSYVAKSAFSYFRKVYTRKNNIESSVGHPCAELQQPAAHAYLGKAVLLVDGKTFSTAADVASTFKSTRRGSIVGRETSGGYEGNTSGRSERIVLSKTGIGVGIPLWYYENAVKSIQPAHRGVIPDVVVTKTLTSIVNHVDVDREKAVSLLQQH